MMRRKSDFHKLFFVLILFISLNPPSLSTFSYLYKSTIAYSLSLNLFKSNYNDGDDEDVDDDYDNDDKVRGMKRKK